MRRCVLALVLAATVATSASAYELYLGAQSQAIPPYDFAAISTFVDLGGDLSPLVDLPIDVHARWMMYGSMFRFQSLPLVEAVTLGASYRWIDVANAEVAPTAGSTLVINRGTSTVGASFDLGVNAGYEPFAFLKVGVPLTLKTYIDGFGLDCGATLRLHAVVIPVALRIGYGFQVMGLWNFSRLVTSDGISVSLGVEL